MSSPETIARLVEQRSNGSASLRMAWTQALESLPPMSARHMKLIGQNAPTPAVARKLGEYISRDKNKSDAINRFFHEIDNSEESVEDWMSAFSILASTIDQTGHKPSLTMASGYLHCCAAVVQTGARYETLPMTVETMLETYGFVGETSSTAG